MSSTTRNWTLAIAAITAISLVAVFNRHSSNAPAPQALRAQSVTSGPADNEVRSAIEQAKVAITNLSVRSSAGIVILSGNADSATAARAVEIAKGLGATRVANLITNRPELDDETIRRSAERELASDRSLYGCSLRISCTNGIVTVSGTIHNELQRDVARQRLRGLSGAQEVRLDLQKI